MTTHHTPSNRSLVLIKLGGSIITNKEVPSMVRRELLTRLVSEIVRAQARSGETYILSHGQGSFAHVPAMRYQTKKGFVNGESRIGMAITQDSAAQLNRIVIKECLAQELPVASFAFSNSLVTKQAEPAHWCSQVLSEYLQQGLVPVTYGDVIVDTAQGCSVWSADKILPFIAIWFKDNSDYQVKKMVHAGEVVGVLDKDKRLVPVVSSKNIKQLKAAMTKIKGFDVTGGMWSKLGEAVRLAQNHQIETQILSGLTPNNLYQALLGQDWKGTRVSGD